MSCAFGAVPLVSGRLSLLLAGCRLPLGVALDLDAAGDGALLLVRFGFCGVRVGVCFTPGEEDR